MRENWEREREESEEKRQSVSKTERHQTLTSPV